ncbi:hypothetical protein [Actinomadura chokoriensis]|uniref:hypothetical protein n=1 Tax=Actinomadura chokoriensis TaxID=454156 RepID=UPI0031F9D010
MNRQNKLVIIVVALLGVGLLVALLPRWLSQNRSAAAASYAFEAAGNGHYVMLDWKVGGETVEGKREIVGCYTEVWTSDAGNPALRIERFRGSQDGTVVVLENPLHDNTISGSFEGGDVLRLSRKFAPVQVDEWSRTTVEQFWGKVPNAGSKVRCE